VRRELAIRPQESLIVVCGGGGADAHFLMNMAAEALARLAVGGRPMRGVLLTGPLMSERRRQALRRRVAGLPVEVWWQVEDQPALLGAADLVVSMAGYNTVMEALVQRRRLLLVPRSGPSAEQSLRATALERLGLAATVAPDDCAPARLAAMIEQQLSGPLPPTPASRGVRLDGLPEVVRELRALAAPRDAIPTLGSGGSAERRATAARGANPYSALRAGER
jgi:predicted glycosyltransferase